MSILLFVVFFAAYCHLYCESKHRQPLQTIAAPAPVEVMEVKEELPKTLVALRKYALSKGIKGAGRMNTAQLRALLA